MVAATRPGTKVQMQVWRKGAAKDLNVTVGELQDEKRAERARKPAAKPADAVSKRGWQRK